MNKRILFWIFLFAAMLTFSFGKANAQTATPTPNTEPPSVEQLLTDVLTLQDENKALKAEIAAKDKAIADYKTVIDNNKLELAKMSGEKTGTEQANIRLTAIIEAMIPMLRRKTVGISIF